MAEQNRRSQTPSMDFRPGRPAGGPMSSRMNVQKPKNMRKTIGRLLKYIGKSKYILIGLCLIMLAVTLLDLLNPFYQQKAIDTIFFRYYDKDTGETLFDSSDPDAEEKLEQLNASGKEYEKKLSVNMDEMRRALLMMGILLSTSALLSYVQGRLAAKLSQWTVFKMRNELFEKISRLPIRYTDTHRHGDIMSRMTNDVENVSNAVSQALTSLLSALITLIGAFSMMLYYSPALTLVAIVTIPLSILVSTKLGKFMRKYFVRQQVLLGQINGTVEEMVTSYKTVVAYGKEQEAIDTFSSYTGELRDTAVKARVWGSIMGPIMNFLGNLQYVMIAAFGGAMALGFIGKKRLSIGTIQAMLQYSKKFTHPINMIASQYSTILTALAGAERIFEIMDSEDETDLGTESISVADVRGDISFSHIDFSYIKGEPVLRDLTLDVRAGQKIAIVGATGSGKTTIVNLLTRFYEVDGGKITIDGRDITTFPKEQLRRIIAIVLQDTVLFSDTIRTNVKYGRLEATDEEMKAATQLSRANLFIDRLPEGYDTQLTEAGDNLSQGQRQLLAIARAVLADPRILILDEATSSVDTRTEMYIQQAMVALMKNRTSLIIAHRLSTIRDADRIVVIRDGHVAEQGSHEELLAQKGEYFKLYQNQFAGIAT